ncbi:AMP-binding protein [Nocardia terpenica]|uniref:AMP-binding protein n=1 Tax=Nocardia terpenica TaxID=455432 RepID=UPI0018931250|nr:AMP-binding protein [Nocardia terpenica]MBF6064832.1 AMP-binding protein [Nocardia terpenica]MBF6107347.1 AMP-binding protein [Nocardia terpenica]MBF6115104.1 AMP-binding protein [Nocardia terpenica]MBF6122210.1 AMP-binding protein [Nocardia terpenica]MBF6154593.1 AMP-binding protein [Nocardia terpenica]
MSPKTIAHTRPATDLLADFAAAVHRHPDRPALVHGDTILTYRDLDTRVRTAAAHLGPTPGIVGVLASHTPATIIQILAILTAGGAYCPLDNTLPPARKHSLATTIGAEYLLSATPNPVAPPGIPIVDTMSTPPTDAPARPPADAPARSSADAPASSPADIPARPHDVIPACFWPESTGTQRVAIDPGQKHAGITGGQRAGMMGHLGNGTAADHGSTPAELAEQPAYVLFTSGSTGRPKPVVTPRRALTAAVGSLRALFEITPEDRVLQFAALSWDTCFEEIFPALTAGAAVVFDDDAHSGSFPRFLRAVAARGVTVLDLPTAMWHELVLYLREEDARLPECVRLVVIGGEGAAPERLRQWRQAGTAGVRLLNTYGCTETTLITHAAELTGDADDRVPLGRALPHVREHVTEEGELLIAGPALALGYLDQPEQTARSFEIADHGDGPRRWFHTGDLVARGDDGLLHPRGRLDDQVKVRGVRVNPAEVEAQLTTHPAVTAAVVIGEQRLGRTALVAYVTVRSPVEPAELTGHLRQRLPGQFVPGIVKILPALATTASGKIDRAAVQRRSTGTMDPPSRGVGR